MVVTWKYFMGRTSMIASFGNKLARDLVEDLKSKEVHAFPAELRRSARKKLAMVHAARAILDLKVPPGNRLERLKGNLKEYYSIRINDPWRVVFKFEDGNAHDVRVEDYHS
jgi:proteic killer suppression protein